MKVRRKCALKVPASGVLVEADLVDELSKDDLTCAHLAWSPIRLEALAHLLKEQRPWPEHWHWDWSKKADLLDMLAFRCLGIVQGDQMQGLMMLSTIAGAGRLPGQQGKAVLPVEYLESAPWNLRFLVAAPRFLGVGVRLLEAAVQISEEEEFGGRVGLHSLPQSEDFYRKYMTDLGPDPKHPHRLNYFEMDDANLRHFLEGRNP